MQADLSKRYDAGALDGFSAESDAYSIFWFRQIRNEEQLKTKLMEARAPRGPQSLYLRGPRIIDCHSQETRARTFSFRLPIIHLQERAASKSESQGASGWFQAEGGNKPKLEPAPERAPKK